MARDRDHEADDAGSWGPWTVQDVDWEPVMRALNTRPEYVASASLTDPAWSDTTVLSGDVAAAVRELKAKPGGEPQVHGSGMLTRWLLENGLVESRVDSKGVTIQVYRPAGRPHYASAA